MTDVNIAELTELRLLVEEACKATDFVIPREEMRILLFKAYTLGTKADIWWTQQDAEAQDGC